MYIRTHHDTRYYFLCSKQFHILKLVQNLRISVTIEKKMSACSIYPTAVSIIAGLHRPNTLSMNQGIVVAIRGLMRLIYLACT